MRNQFWNFIWMVLLCPMALLGADTEKSVVQIFTFSQQPVWDSPWRFDSVRRGTGTGFVIKGKKIMTNAHVVGWARQILVKRFQDPRPYPARVVHVGHDCDLAILEIEGPGFHEDLEPLEIGDLPKVRTPVVTYGYPAGGEQISYTRGVVSRIELQNYVHIGNRAMLGVQTDAAINPGNSGGPVMQDNKVVGVAFMGIQGLENTGFFIPPEVIKHFLKDIEDGVYNGVPQAGIRAMPLQNPAFRAALKLPDDDTGARVDYISPDMPAGKLIQQDDVLLKVAGFPVASDGSIIYEGNRVQLGFAFQGVQDGETVPVVLWRAGKKVDLDLPVKVYAADKPIGNQYDILPKYYVYAGLVFTPLSLDYVKSFGRNWSDSAGQDLLYEMYYRRYESPETLRREPVVLAATLTDAVNANMRVQARTLVDKINGIKIQSMEDVARAFETATTDQHLIEFVPHAIECLDRKAAGEAHSKILKTYGVPKDRRL